MTTDEPDSTAPRNAVIERLKEHIASGNRLSPKYGALADYILHHPNEGAFSTAAELALAANVSEATVIRFANFLSYASYSDFKRDFQKWVNDELTTIHRMTTSIHLPTGDDSLSQVRRAEMENLENMLSSVSRNDIEMAAGLVVGAKRVFVVGLRASAGLARYFAYETSEILPSVTAVTTGGADVMTDVASCTDGVMLAFGFPRYPRDTIAIMDTARGNGLSLVSITDSFASPLAERSDVTLFAPMQSIGPVDLFAAPLAVASAIVLEAARADQDGTLASLARFERVADAVGLYWPDASA